MRNGQRRSRSGGVARWLVPALLLHIASALVLAALSRATGPAWAPLVSASNDAWHDSTLQLIFVDDEGPSRAQQGVERATRGGLPGAMSRHAGSASMATRALRASGLPAASEAAEPPTMEADATGSMPGVNQRNSPTLSLDQLGIGTTNPFHWVAPEAPSRAQRDNRRLQASLYQGRLDDDRARGLGAEGPVLGAARRLVLASEALVETSAVLNVLVDAAGRVTSVDVLQLSSQAEDWRLMAQALMAALTPVRLRVAASSEPFGMKLRITSALRLPSGADPGLRLGLLGQTLREGEGPRSASLSLSPTAPLRRVEVFDSAGRHQDRPLQFELGALELKGDVADSAASAQRVVQLSVLSVDLRQTQ